MSLHCSKDLVLAKPGTRCDNQGQMQSTTKLIYFEKMEERN